MDDEVPVAAVHLISDETVLLFAAAVIVCVLVWGVLKQWWDGNAWRRQLRKRSL
jgi:hypothetical protein